MLNYFYFQSQWNNVDDDFINCIIKTACDGDCKRCHYVFRLIFSHLKAEDMLQLRYGKLTFGIGKLLGCHII